MCFHMSFMKLVPYVLGSPFSEAIMGCKDFTSEKHNCCNMWDTLMMAYKSKVLVYMFSWLHSESSFKAVFVSKLGIIYLEGLLLFIH